MELAELFKHFPMSMESMHSASIPRRSARSNFAIESGCPSSGESSRSPAELDQISKIPKLWSFSTLALEHVLTGNH